MGNHASHEKVVQDCQAAIARFRQAMSDGSVNTPEQHEDWELVLRTLRHYLTPVANMLDRHMPGAGRSYSSSHTTDSATIFAAQHIIHLQDSLVRT